MTIKEFKKWINNLPEDMADFALVIRTLKTAEEGKFSQKDEPMVSSLIDQNQKRLCLFDIDSQKVIEEIRKAAASNAEQSIEGSPLPTEENK
jgi:hypothetical protein